MIGKQVVPVSEPVELDPARLPAHVGVIMDGNGRWARQRGWERVRGHHRGADVVRMIATVSRQLGVGRVTLYAFSSENWSRPKAEVGVLMRLLQDFLKRERDTLMENGIRLSAIGRLGRLPDGPRSVLAETCRVTAHNDGMDLCLALSYGGRDEIVDAVARIAAAAQRGEVDPAAIDQDLFAEHLYAADAPDVDVVIRTAGEQRMSNFLLWQAAYAEYISVPELWPDFTESSYRAALACYQSRDRRFGRV